MVGAFQCTILTRFQVEDALDFTSTVLDDFWTINVALADAKSVSPFCSVYGEAALTFLFSISRKSSATAKSLEIYRDLIKTATADLEAHLESIDEMLKIIFEQTVTESD
jgi:Fungal N-terminal domain of STAND proteins